MKQKVAILGATGTVGQKAIALLAKHPLFEITELIASDARSGQVYGELVHWRENREDLSPFIASIKLTTLDDLTAPFVLSCLPTDVAFAVERTLAERGHFVFSNAAAHRMDPRIPLLIPEINTDSLALLNEQLSLGKIITNPNCAAVFVTLALRPLLDLGIVQHVGVVTLQSTSGAGYPGVPADDILGNIIPYIAYEEIKIECESKKILSSVIAPEGYSLTAQVTRVPVKVGHTAMLQIHFQNAVPLEFVYEVYQAWNVRYPNLYTIYDAVDRPQPAWDIGKSDMGVHMGQIKSREGGKIISLVAMGNNVVRGAAGAAITNMETCLRLGVLEGKKVLDIF